MEGMHSVLDMLFTGISENLAEVLFDSLQKECKSLEKILSCFDPGSEIYRINEKAPFQNVPVSERLWDILVECLHFNQLTLGYFDIGLKRLKTNHPAQGTKPYEPDEKTGIHFVEMNERHHSLRFASPAVALDFGAVGKGYALRAFNQVLMAHDVQNCFISFGGSSILTRGHHPYGDCWPVDFRTGCHMNKVFEMRDDFASFSRSIPEGSTDQIPHIMDPRTRKPVVNNRLTGVQCRCPVTAEVLSTVFILATHEEASSMASYFQTKKVYITDLDKNTNPINELYYEL